MKRYLQHICRLDAVDLAARLLDTTKDGMECTYDGALHSVFRNPANDCAAIVYEAQPNDFGVCLFKDGEFDRRTYVCRDLKDIDLYDICARYCFMTKPVKPFTIDEALTEPNARYIHEFLGDESMMVWVVLDTLKGFDGTMSNSDEIIDFLSKSTDSGIVGDNKESIRASFEYYMIDRFLKYALYEFLRTEDYAHLCSILSSYAQFGLSEGWENRSLLLKGLSSLGDVERVSEMYILGCYLYKNSKHVAEKSHKDISAFTGIPMDLIERALNISDAWRYRAAVGKGLSTISNLIR